jgi:adenine phosphoribosyltransferase
MPDLKQYIASVPDFPKPGILFRDMMPLLRQHLPATIDALDALLSAEEWARIDLEYGTTTLEMQPGEGNVLLVDDVVATSGTMAAAAELCQRSGFKVQGLVALMDLKLGPRLHWNGLTLRTALDHD